MPSNTVVNFENINQFTSKALTFDAHGCKGTVNAGTTGNVDLKLLDDSLINGIQLAVKGGTFGDTANFQCVDVDGLLGHGTNFVLNQYATNWCMLGVDGQQVFIETPYTAKIPAGMYLRVAYTSTGTMSVMVAANYLLHKVLY